MYSDVMRPWCLALVVQWAVFVASSTHFIFLFLHPTFLDYRWGFHLSFSASNAERMRPLSIPTLYLFMSHGNVELCLYDGSMNVLLVFPGHAKESSVGAHLQITRVHF